MPDDETGLRLRMGKEQALKLRHDTVTQCMNTIQRRIDGLGIAETAVQQRGGSNSSEILVQLPGVDDPARVKEILKTKAMLEFSGVVGCPYTSEAAAKTAYNGELPANTRLVRGHPQMESGKSWWLLSRSTVITGSDLRDAHAQASEIPGRWDTNFLLTASAAKRFGQYTEANINNRLAIVLDNVVLNAPRIETKSLDQCRITGAQNLQDAADLALNLRAGSLPAGIKFTEERTVGPSLGSDSIHRGIFAGVVGLTLVVASMIAYYRGAGLNAISSLILNTIITIAALSYLEATWTLPGIASLVLSIGMAVDSNVLIFERIKEELQSGKRIGAAISCGFKRALITIVDTHVTTVVASAFLLVFGTGPVRGFAVTLVIGLVANLFTAVFVSRAIFDFQLWLRPKAQNLSIGSRRMDLFHRSDIAFMNKRTLALGISAMAIIMSIAGIVGYGLKPGLDFRGGALIQVRIAGPQAIDDLRRALSNKLPGEISVQETGENGRFLISTELAAEDKLAATREKIVQILRERYGISDNKLDLNTANQSALHERLKGSLAGHGIVINDEETRNLAAKILGFRDRENGGIIHNMDQVASVEGVTQDILKIIKETCAAGRFHILSTEIVDPRPLFFGADQEAGR